MPARNKPDRDREQAAPDDHQDRGRDDDRQHCRHRGDRDREAVVVAFLRCASMKIFDWLAASAVEEPEMPAKKSESTTLTCARPPGSGRPGRDRRTSRVVMPPTFMRFAVGEERHREQDERVVGVEGLLHQVLRREPVLDDEDRQAGEAERERDRHAQREQREEHPERGDARRAGIEDGRAGHVMLPGTRRRAGGGRGALPATLARRPTSARRGESR